MNLSGLQTEISRLLGDPSNDRWPLTLINTRINEAQTIINGYVGAVKTKETLTPTASTRTVTLDSETMDISRVCITRTDGSIYELDGYTVEGLDYDYPNWQNIADGAPSLWYYDATNQQLGLVPKPDSSNAIASGLFVWEIRKPADVTNASDIPFDSNNQVVPYHMAVVYWVVAQCWMDDGTPEALAKSRFFKTGVMTQNGGGQYEHEVMRMMAKFDRPESIPENIRWRPTGGRQGASNVPSKQNPFAGL